MFSILLDDLLLLKLPNIRNSNNINRNQMSISRSNIQFPWKRQKIVLMKCISLTKKLTSLAISELIWNINKFDAIWKCALSALYCKESSKVEFQKEHYLLGSSRRTDFHYEKCSGEYTDTSLSQKNIFC